MKRYILATALLANISGCTYDTFTEIEEPSFLISNFYSYRTLEETLSALDKRDSPYAVERGTEAGKGKGAPYKIDTIELDRYTLEGHEGRLVVSFFNDRLMSCVFFPQDYESMLGMINTSIGLVRDSERMISKHTRIRTYKDYRGEEYIAWEDSRLSDQHMRWISKYS
nr:putative uncharacterized protein [uncultured bacterium]